MTLLPAATRNVRLTFSAVFVYMVKAVYVHAPVKADAERVQDVDISDDLIGMLPYSVLVGLQNGETA